MVPRVIYYNTDSLDLRWTNGIDELEIAHEVIGNDSVFESTCREFQKAILDRDCCARAHYIFMAFCGLRAIARELQDAAKNGQ